jgi:dihydroorotase
MADKLTIPAAIDLHVHFREPGDNKAETIKSGSKAALQGGYALVCDMPNNPGNPTWTMERLQTKQGIINKSAYVPVATYAGSQPQEDNLQELEAMGQAAIGLKLYGATTTGNEYNYDAKDFEAIVARWHELQPDKPIMLHSGSDNFADFVELIAKKHKHHLHLAHVNNPKDVHIATEATKAGLSVSCGICPHHLLKTSYDTHSEGWFARMLPPLAHQDQADELFKLFAKGDIDVLETDHAPHTLENKWQAETENPEGVRDMQTAACFGVPGIEFALPLMFYQIERGRLSLDRLIEASSKLPAEIIGIKLSDDTKVIWKMERYRIGHEDLELSGAGWSPYLDKIAVGKVWQSQAGGKTLIKDGKIVAELSQVAQRGDTI